DVYPADAATAGLVDPPHGEARRRFRTGHRSIIAGEAGQEWPLRIEDQAEQTQQQIGPAGHGVGAPGDAIAAGGAPQLHADLGAASAPIQPPGTAHAAAGDGIAAALLQAELEAIFAVDVPGAAIAAG